MLFNDDNMASEDAGWARVPEAAGFDVGQLGPHAKVAFEAPIVAQQSGYIYIWVSNESEGAKVWFDDLKVTHTQTLVTQATDYGVWGDVLREMKAAEITYRHGYQGQFAEKDDETGWNHFELREYDPVIGRWTSKDPYGQYWSPYVGMGNDPTNRTDPDGGFDWYLNNATGDLEWINGNAEVKGYTYLGEDLTFSFSSFIDRASFDGMFGLRKFWDFSGEKLSSTIHLDFSQDSEGNLVGSPIVSMSSNVHKTFNWIPGMPNLTQSDISSIGNNGSGLYNIILEKHTMVNWFLEAGPMTAMGYDVVNVAQRLEITGGSGKLNYKASTDIFPSARLWINNIRVMNYVAPSFQKSHGNFSSPLVCFIKEQEIMIIDKKLLFVLFIKTFLSVLLVMVSSVDKYTYIQISTIVYGLFGLSLFNSIFFSPLFLIPAIRKKNKVNVIRLFVLINTLVIWFGLYSELSYLMILICFDIILVELYLFRRKL